MQKTILLATFLFCLLTISSCTNDEDEEKIDVLTPADTAKIEHVVQDPAL